MSTNHGTLGLLLLVGCLSAGCGQKPVGIGRQAEAHAPESAESVASNQETTPSKLESEFRFPPDRGGQFLSEKLRPANQIPPLANDKPAEPIRRSGPKNVENPDVSPPTASLTAPPSIPIIKIRPIRPTLVGACPPLSSELFELADPAPVKLPAGPKVAWPSPDIYQPIPLPILARPVTDRASLDDPSGEASQAAALASMVPDRTTPAPFLRLTLPDPFEHRNAIRLRTPPPEIGLPPELSRYAQP